MASHHSGLLNIPRRPFERESSHRRNELSVGTGTHLTEHPALSTTVDNPSFISPANSVLLMGDAEDIQRAFTQFNQSPPDTGIREIWESLDTLFNNPSNPDEPRRVQSHTQPAATPDTLCCNQDTTQKPYTTSNKAWHSSFHPSHTNVNAHIDGPSDIQQPDQNGIYWCFWLGCADRHGFSRDMSLWRHIKAKHLHPRSFKCPAPSCARSFDRRDSLHAHQRTAGHCT